MSSKKTKKILRQIDKSTQLMSDDEYFPPVLAPKSEPLPEGHIRVDDSTVVKGVLAPKQTVIGPGAKKKKGKSKKTASKK